MQKQKTIYHLIVDKSGSMTDCIEPTISGFNEQVTKIQQLEKEYSEQEITIGLTTFNHEVYHHFFQSPAAAVRKLDTDNYRPDGTTALIDAIGMTVQTIEKEIQHHNNQSNTTVVIVILTDGYENASKSFNLASVRKMISRLEETGTWTFSFIG
ncbi:MAG: VWA domain-containing protein, partial [Crocinitomicaceae bacterium]|nr:VWA domain-containing protein [Crocinitomicaceae bacterium]